MRSAAAAFAVASSVAVYVATTQTNEAQCFWPFSTVPAVGKKLFPEIRAKIAKLIENDPTNGPLFVRLAWHSAGTFDKSDGSGGSNGGTMRFAPECSHGANAGLGKARDLLEPIKKEHPEISYADLYTLCGVEAVEQAGGPVVPWRSGRSDAKDGSACTPDGRLPDAIKEEDHLRAVFYRMGFNDQEIVALAGAHTLGHCHKDRSGFDGPWTHDPFGFDNQYFTLLLESRWAIKKGSCPMQFEDDETKTLMMLPADIAFIKDPKFKRWVEVYSNDSDRFFADFADAFAKLLELGCTFDEQK